MTQLAGQNGAGWTPVNSNDFGASQSELRVAGGYTAIAGAMATFHVTVGATGSALLATGYVYSGSGPGATLVGMSAEFDVSTTGDKAAAIAGSLSVGPVLLCVQCATGVFLTVTNSGSANNVGRTVLIANFPYRSPPATMPPSDTSVGHEFICWVDGTQGTNTYVLPASPVTAAAAIAQSSVDVQLTAATLPAGASVVGSALLSVLAGVPQTDPPPYWPLMPGAKGRGRM